MLIGGIGSGVAGVGMFVLMGVSISRVSSLQDEPAFTTYRTGLSPDQSACEQADAGVSVKIAGAATPESVQSICSQASTFEALTYASIPLGVVFLGLGSFLVIKSDTVWPMVSGKKAEAPRIRFVPQVGGEGAHGTLHVSF